MLSVLLNLASIIIVFVFSILVSIHGWGLEPKSWGWIIFGSLTGIFISALLQVAAKELD